MAEKKTVKAVAPKIPTSPVEEMKLMKHEGHYFYANGKRKTSVARVRLYENGKGEIVVNNRPVAEYFFSQMITNVKAPLKMANVLKLFDVIALIEGGGINSQADALRHGISKALLQYDPELRSQLKKAGFLTRDARVKERKKPGLKRARRAPQWAKR